MPEDHMSISWTPPHRITDLVAVRRAGARVTVQTAFDIVPADFAHREHSFRAYIFLCRYSGTLDGRPYEFRKCYARGCPNNLCTHVSQAVAIANRYLQRDLHRLGLAGIDVAQRAFSLPEMLVKFENLKEQAAPALTVEELIDLVGGHRSAVLEVKLERVPAVEHFAHHRNAQTFLSGEFTAYLHRANCHSQRCLACYPTDQEAEAKPLAVKIANARLDAIYREFAQRAIRHDKRYFD
jgi:hypothetical protein